MKQKEISTGECGHASLWSDLANVSGHTCGCETSQAVERFQTHLFPIKRLICQREKSVRNPNKENRLVKTQWKSQVYNQITQ